MSMDRSYQHALTLSSFRINARVVCTEKVSLKQIQVECWSNFLSDFRVAQVRVVFQIPQHAISELFPNPKHLHAAALPTHLAYVKWFSPISATPDKIHLLYKVSRLATHNGDRTASIIPVDSICSSVHLFPRHLIFLQLDNLNSSTVLKWCHSFYINPFSNRDNYMIFS